MNDALKRFLLGVAACLALIRQSSFPQSIPVPEYFGVYAVVDGRLLKLDGQEVRSDKNVTVRLGQRNAVSDVVSQRPATLSPKRFQIPSFPADLKIVIFAQSSGVQSPLDTAKSLHLESLVFVRNLNVDTGWPNNIQRTDHENGWDSGDAVELAVIASGDHARELEFLIKPMSGQKDIVVAGLADKLKPGVYRLSIGSREPSMPSGGGMLFAVEPISQGEMEKCVDASLSYATTTVYTKYTPCTGPSDLNPSNASTQANVSPAGGNAPGGGSGTAACSDYDGCLRAAMNAYKARDWGSATAAFKAAANQRPTSGEPWIWLGRILFRDGQSHRLEDLSNVWDKALLLGAEIMIGACHERTLQSCERGDLALSAKSISFLADGTRPVFAVTPSEIDPGRILNNSAAAHIAYSMRVTRKNYSFDFIPQGVTACTFGLMVQCPQEGITEQLILAQYVSQTLPKLARGTLNATVGIPGKP